MLACIPNLKFLALQAMPTLLILPCFEHLSKLFLMHVPKITLSSTYSWHMMAVVHPFITSIFFVLLKLLASIRPPVLNSGMVCLRRLR